MVKRLFMTQSPIRAITASTERLVRPKAVVAEAEVVVAEAEAVVAAEAPACSGSPLLEFEAVARCPTRRRRLATAWASCPSSPEGWR